VSDIERFINERFNTDLKTVGRNAALANLQKRQRFFKLSNVRVDSVGLASCGANGKPFFFCKSADYDNAAQIVARLKRAREMSEYEQRGPSYGLGEAGPVTEFSTALDELTRAPEYYSDARPLDERIENCAELARLDDLWRYALQTGDYSEMPGWLATRFVVFSGTLDDDNAQRLSVERAKGGHVSPEIEQEIKELVATGVKEHDAVLMILQKHGLVNL